jgi:O-6-methylguanine DNA methyltransferase
MDNSFQKTVYRLTKSIPKGKVATYGQIARLSGKPKAARAIGLLMKNNPDAPDTPCHRVVASNGELTGYSGVGGVVQKKKMLLKEGVYFKKDKVDLFFSQWEK